MKDNLMNKKIIDTDLEKVSGGMGDGQGAYDQSTNLVRMKCPNPQCITNDPNNPDDLSKFESFSGGRLKCIYCGYQIFEPKGSLPM
ncbi:MAG: hypothetical protein IJT16_07800 [Lachnospiraceae bacterium]|nr:hypothetical protein [Lachnospiraceae bacterium]